MPKKTKKSKTPVPAKELAQTDVDQGQEEEQVNVQADVVTTKGTTKSETDTQPTPTVIKTDKPKKQPLPQWVWMTAVGVIVVGAAAVVGWKLFGGTSSTSTLSNTGTNTNTTALVPRVIDGVPVTADESNPNTYAIVIENQIDSRPPSSLDKASVVYETLAEGGITRFLALFPITDKLPEVGPVRSARPYFISWAQEYGNPLFVHAGGSPEALSLLQKSSTKVVDFNQFYHGGNFIRDTKRIAPHNLYTNDTLLYTGLRRTDLREAVPNYTSWTYKDEPVIDQRPVATNDIVINFSSLSYKASYKYDRALNQYQRYLADKPHVTRTNDQIYAKNIVVEFTDMAVTQNNHGRMQIRTTGTGKLYLFRDGTMVEGTWQKDSDTARTKFLDSRGNVLALDAGTTWVEVVSTTTKVTY